MTSELLVKEYDPTLIDFGFYPSMIDKNKIAIADTKNDRELRFIVEDHEFEVNKAKNFNGDVPKKIKNIINKKNEWFEDFEIVNPKKIARDPFLFGVKNGKHYFICCWNTDIWDK